MEHWTVQELLSELKQKEEDCQLAASAGQALLLENTELKETIKSLEESKRSPILKLFNRSGIDPSYATDIQNHLVNLSRKLTQDLNLEKQHTALLKAKLTDSKAEHNTLRKEIKRLAKDLEKQSEKSWNLEVIISNLEETVSNYASQLSKTKRDIQKLTRENLNNQEAWKEKESLHQNELADLETRLYFHIRKGRSSIDLDSEAREDALIKRKLPLNENKEPAKKLHNANIQTDTDHLQLEIAKLEQRTHQLVSELSESKLEKIQIEAVLEELQSRIDNIAAEDETGNARPNLLQSFLSAERRHDVETQTEIYQPVYRFNAHHSSLALSEFSNDEASEIERKSFDTVALKPSSSRATLAISIGKNTEESGNLPDKLAALTFTMVGGWFNKRDKNPHMRYFWINPYSRMLNWSLTSPSQLSQGEKTKKAEIVSMQWADAPNTRTQIRNFLPDYENSILIQTPNRVIRMQPLSWNDHEQWITGIKALLKLSPSPSSQQLFSMNANDNYSSESAEELGPESTGGRQRVKTVYSKDQETPKKEVKPRKSLMEILTPKRKRISERAV